MSKQSVAGKREWQRRALGYASALRTSIEQRVAGPRIERRAAARFARWQARGRLPLWLRVKQRLRGVLVSARAGRQS